MTALDDILALLGAPERPPVEAAARVTELERQLGRPLPAATRTLLLRPPPLADPDAADHPEIDELDFFAGLPDVDAWLPRLASGLEGPLLACAQFCGLVPFAVRLDRGDFTYAMASIDGDRILTFDEREIAVAAPSPAHFLAAEIERYRERRDYDCFRLTVADGAALPALEALEAEPPGPPDGRSRWWICAALRGEIAAWALDAIPTPETWEAERERVAGRHGDAMFWLLAHAILGNRAELADAAELSRANPSRLVAALRDWLSAHPDFIDRHREWRSGLYDLARRNP